MPPLPAGGFTLSSSTVNPPDNQQEELEYVFENMPFHGINQHGPRRHSLTIQRCNSFIAAQLQSSANSLLVTPNTSENDLDNAQAVQTSQPLSEDASFFFLEMDMITSLGNSDITDTEMVEVLDKLITFC